MPRPQDKERAKLRLAIRLYRDWYVCNHTKGGGDPADWPEITRGLSDARKHLEATIDEVLPH